MCTPFELDIRKRKARYQFCADIKLIQNLHMLNFTNKKSIIM